MRFLRRILAPRTPYVRLYREREDAFRFGQVEVDPVRLAAPEHKAHRVFGNMVEVQRDVTVRDAQRGTALVAAADSRGGLCVPGQRRQQVGQSFRINLRR